MTYQLRVSQPSTGHGLPAAGSPPTAATAIISNPDENSTEASDFQIIPSSGTLPPNFHQTIQVCIEVQSSIIMYIHNVQCHVHVST